jgi:hypothetical protein
MTEVLAPPASSTIAADINNTSPDEATISGTYNALADADWYVEITVGGAYATFKARLFDAWDNPIGAQWTPVSGVPQLVANGISVTFTDGGASVMVLGDRWDIENTAAGTNEFMVIAPQALSGGYDGLGALADNDYTEMLSSQDSPFNQLFGKNLGLVKLAAPGVTATAIQKAGAAYAEAKNYQWRYEVPANITDESAADAWLSETIGKNDFAVCAFPSFAYVTNPTGAGKKLVSMTGGIHGREALVAKNYDGYHKAAAGVDVTLPTVLSLPTGDKVINEELLNPRGFQIIKFKQGNAIIWGDRSASVDPAWKWKHQRELLSHYEHVLQENFDWIVFAINDPVVQQLAYNAVLSYFLPEYTKGALDRNISLDQALIIKIDKENNPASERAAGNLNMEISLALADTVERFKVTMNKTGIFEAAA